MSFLFFLVACIVPVMVVSFKPHRLLFNFDYTSLKQDDNGHINFQFFFQAEGIQFFFICFTFFVSFFIETKYNKLNFRVVYETSSWMEICSRLIIFIWSAFLFLSSVTLLPRAENCHSDDICTCKFDINKANYGCDRNATHYN